MTGYQISAFFGTPAAVALLAWGMVGLHRLLPRPDGRILARDGLSAGHLAVRVAGLTRDAEHNARPPGIRKTRKALQK